MKLYKLFALAAAAVTMTACSNDDDKVVWNTADGVTVDMLQGELITKEGKGIVNVPIVVNGPVNGNVVVTVECTETGLNPAIADQHYYVTTNTIIISGDEKAGNVELYVVDPEQEINENRTFEIRIVSAEHAAIGAQNFTAVTIKDNDRDPYDKLTGDWVGHIIPRGATAEKEVAVNIQGFDEDEEGYHEYYIVTGLQTYCEIEMDYYYDEDSQEGYLEMPFGQQVATVNFTGYGALPVYFCKYTPPSSLSLSGSAYAEWVTEINGAVQNVTEIYFPEVASVGYFPNTGSSWLLWTTQEIVKFTR